VPCYGAHNIPDGECFTCPVRDSVEGTIAINTNSVYEGTMYRDIRFTLRKGKIVEATCADDGDRPGAGNPRKLNRLLDSDEGARYIGEWSLGFNRYILHPMNDTLFDGEDRRVVPLHAGQRLRRGGQRQPLAGALGPGGHPGVPNMAAARSISTARWCARTGSSCCLSCRHSTTDRRQSDGNP
jgi:hypothetical protein